VSVSGPALEELSKPERLERLHRAVLVCTRCGLSGTRTNAVPGTGPCPADIMIVGEAPGFNEDAQGKPFVGQAGKLLDTLLAGIGLRREDVYITNVLKCRPPQNRDPMPNEVEACAPYLNWQLKLVEPKVVIVLGRHALERLLPGHGPISRVHGQLVDRSGINYVAVYHPAAALHNGSLVNDLQADFLKVRQYLDEILSPPPPPEPEPDPPAGPEQLSLI
jgi:uracil-DNA glycosylase